MTHRKIKMINNSNNKRTHHLELSSILILIQKISHKANLSKIMKTKLLTTSSEEAVVHPPQTPKTHSKTTVDSTFSAPQHLPNSQILQTNTTTPSQAMQSPWTSSKKNRSRNRPSPNSCPTSQVCSGPINSSQTWWWTKCKLLCSNRSRCRWCNSSNNKCLEVVCNNQINLWLSQEDNSSLEWWEDSNNNNNQIWDSTNSVQINLRWWGACNSQIKDFKQTNNQIITKGVHLLICLVEFAILFE